MCIKVHARALLFHVCVRERERKQETQEGERLLRIARRERTKIEKERKRR